MTSHPRIPIRPPAPGFLFGTVEPALRIRLKVVVKPVTAFVARWRIDHACDVPAGSQDESCLTTDQIFRTKCRLPGHDVIRTGCEEIERYGNHREVYRNSALRGLAWILDVVLKIGVARVPAVHWPRQAHAVGIPIQQIASVGR